ncbi:Spy/CpxP family protein refolding chaperone [Burkholderia pyrrocinia]|uniref:Spy/CpxP family protein refolding chaperone n=1 Tax=Burkholderia pyrrocinia TaxID=60550 RepID=UPI0030D1A676
MRLIAPPSRPRTASVFAIAVFLALTAFANPASAASPAQTQAPASAMTVATQDRIDTRINNLHDRLQITAAQEELWRKVAQVMRDNAGTMDSLRQARTSHADSMSAIDDLKSYGQVADAHADGIRKLTPAFQALYDSMSEAQKKNADLIFRTDHHHSAKKG